MSHLLPTISHEILNPLAAVQSLLEVVAEETDHSQHLADLEAAQEEIARLRLLVRGLGFDEIDPTGGGRSVDLASIVVEVLEIHRRRADQLGVALRYTGEGEVHAKLPPDLFRLVANNLITNALDACRKGDEVEVSLHLAGAAAAVEFLVVDSGEGMSVATQARAAEPFFTTRVGVSGIGLTLVREAVGRCGGQLKIESRTRCRQPDFDSSTDRRGLDAEIPTIWPFHVCFVTDAARGSLLAFRRSIKSAPDIV